MFGSKSIKGMSMISNAANAAHPQPSPKPASRAEMKEEHSSKEERPSMPNLIGKGTIIEGNIVAEGDLVVEGTVRGDVTTNTVEGYFSIFKRGMKGVYQHCAKHHLHRYAAEFAFRYSNRVANGIGDVARTDIALNGVVGKRVLYRDSLGA